MSQKIYNEVPAQAWYYLTRVAGSAKTKESAKDYLKHLHLTQALAKQFSYFMNNEWIFDNPSAFKLQALVKEHEPNLNLNFDVRVINWPVFIRNHAYGIKKHIFGEETYLPSLSYCDARMRIFSPYKLALTDAQRLRELAPTKTVKPYSEAKQVVLMDPWVQQEIEKRVQSKISYQNRAALVANSAQEKKVRQEVELESEKMLQRIYSSFRQEQLTNLVEVLG
jgi:hypothetical protein